MSKILPKYPIFIPSHKRSDNALTPKLFMQYGVPFKLVVDKSEYDNYAKIYGDHNLLVLPFLNNGTPCPPRVWIMNYSRDQMVLSFQRQNQNTDTTESRFAIM